MLRNNWVAAVRGFADREMTYTRQTRKSPTHNRHEMKRGQILPEFSFDGVVIYSLGLRNPIASCVSDGSNIGVHFGTHNRAVGRLGGHFGKVDCS